MSNNVLFTPHSKKQQAAISSKKRITVVGTGTQWGKTVVGAIRMLAKTTEFFDKTDNFIVTAPSYKILGQSTLVAFRAFAQGLGKFNEQKATFQVYGGGTVYFRTEHDPDSIVGITNVRHIWADEAGKYRRYFWENIQARANLLGSSIDLTTSPYSLNWIYKELIKPCLEGKRPDVELVQAASWENPGHFLSDPKQREYAKANMDKRRFDMLFGGQWGHMIGRVYDCFDEETHVVEPFKLPTGTKYYAGIDWGFTQPFVLVVRAVTPDGLHVQISELYKTGLTLSDMVELAKQKKELFNIEVFWCGPDQPGYIEEFNRKGLVAAPANNDVRYGVELHYELIKTNKYQVFDKSSPYTLDEYEGYHWPEPVDVGPDRDLKDQNPVKQNDHAMDANRYVSVMTYGSQKTRPQSLLIKETKSHTKDTELHKLLRRGPKVRLEEW